MSDLSNLKAFPLGLCSAAVSNPSTEAAGAPGLVILWHGSQIMVSGEEPLMALRAAVDHALGIEPGKGTW